MDQLGSSCSRQARRETVVLGLSWRWSEDRDGSTEMEEAGQSL